MHLVLYASDHGSLSPWNVRNTLFAWGPGFKQAITVFLLAGALMPIAFFKVLKPYQRERLTSFMNPDADRQGSGYQVNQS